MEWLGCTSEQLELLYRASHDGWDASNFHEKCDNRGATLTIIKSTGGYIFGGYISASWHSNNIKISSEEAFLFTLINHANILPTKMDHKHDEYQAYGSSSYGPTFGGGHDIKVASNANMNTDSFINIGNSYHCPSGIPYASRETFLTGSNNFQASEIEVYCVKK